MPHPAKKLRWDPLGSSYAALIWCSASSIGYFLDWFSGAACFRRCKRCLWHLIETPPGRPIQQSTTYCPFGGEEVMVLCLVKHIGDRKDYLLKAYYTTIYTTINPTKMQHYAILWQQKQDFPTPTLNPAEKWRQSLIEPLYATGMMMVHAMFQSRPMQLNWYIVSLNQRSEIKLDLTLENIFWLTLVWHRIPNFNFQSWKISSA